MSATTTMNNPATHADVYALFQTAQVQAEARGDRLEVKIDTRADRMEAMFRIHSADDAVQFKDLGDRVLTIEIERAQEQRQAAKRGALAGLIAGSGTFGLIEVLKHLAGWK